MSKVIDRSTDNTAIKAIDTCANKFKWEWLETVVDNVALSSCIRKIDSSGKAKCILCDKLISYGNRGKVSLTEHCSSAQHKSKVKTVKQNTQLPSSYTGGNSLEEKTYGIHPMFKNVPIKVPEAPKPVVSLEDRSANAQVCFISYSSVSLKG